MAKSKSKKIKEKSCVKCTKVSKFNPTNPMVKADFIKALYKSRSKGCWIGDLAKRFETSEAAIVKLANILSKQGYNITRDEEDNLHVNNVVPPMPNLNIKKLRGKEITFGVVSDTHLCSKYSRLDVLEAAYDMFEQQGITQVFHGGNIIDGEFKFNKYEILAHGIHDQTNYLADHYPQRAGITTYFISGDCHEGWFMKDTGLNVGWYMENWCRERGRKDLIHIGHLEQDVVFNRPGGDFRMRIIHPGGGTPYATSYPSQKMVESFQGGDKPQLLIMGHFHKFDFGYPREVACLLPGATQDQTGFMRKKKLASHVGFCMCNLGVRDDGTLGEIGVKWIPFYDVAYHRHFNTKDFKMPGTK